MTTMVSFLAAGITFLALLTTLATVYYKRSRGAAESTWDELMGRLIFVDRNGVRQIALDLVDNDGNPRTDDHAKRLDAEEIWMLIGGLEGLEILQQNSRVFLDIATYLQAWHPEVLCAAEELRLNARQLEWHIGRLQIGARNNNLSAWFGAYARNAVTTYFIMTQQLLHMCGSGMVRCRADLERSL